MEVGALKVLVAGLLTWINVHSTLPLPKDQPEVSFLPHNELENVVCHHPCAVLGFSPDDDSDVIMLDQSLELTKNACDRSILLHELVHFMQRRDKRWSDEKPEVRSHWREMEALEVQRAYLEQFGRNLFITRGFAATGLPYPYC